MRGGASEVNETQKWATSKKMVENHCFKGLKYSVYIRIFDKMKHVPAVVTAFISL
jgi:hypothetical protein